MTTPIRLGVIGTGALGGAITRAALRSSVVHRDSLGLSNRSGRLAGFDAWPGLRATTRPQDLLAGCDLLLLALPPAALRDLVLDAGDCPVLSVMAGATVAQINARSGSARVLRAMSSPAAERGLAFSPIFAAPGVSDADRILAQRLLDACGATAFVDAESEIDVFTALTGPVPGFVALFARAMVDFAVEAGVAPATADRAVRQLFLASGRAMTEDFASPADHVRAVLDYAGTTAAGLARLEALGIDRTIHEGLAAAVARARSIATDD